MTDPQKAKNGLEPSKKEASSSWARILFGTGVILIAVVVFAIMQGDVRGRWSSSEELQEAAIRLDQLPESFGPWHPIESIELPDYALAELEMEAYRSGIYEHEETGERVTFLLMLGPSGLMAVHTPEICLGGQSFKHVGESTRRTFSFEDDSESEKQDSFWKAKFQETAIDGNYHVIYYAWSLGRHWQSPRNTRMKFGTSPYLYKVHVGASSLSENLFSQANDSASNFLEHFIPESRCLAP